MTLLKGHIIPFDMGRDYYDFFMIELDRFDQPMTKILTQFLKKKYGSDYWFVVDVTGDLRIDAYLIAGREERGDEQVVHVYSIAVRRDLEGQGWGRKLMDHLLCKIRENDSEVSAVFLEVRDNNDRAILFYEKYGFNRTGIEENYYEDGVDAINMRLELNDYE